MRYLRQKSTELVFLKFWQVWWEENRNKDILWHRKNIRCHYFQTVCLGNLKSSTQKIFELVKIFITLIFPIPFTSSLSRWLFHPFSSLRKLIFFLSSLVPFLGHFSLMTMLSISEKNKTNQKRISTCFHHHTCPPIYMNIFPYTLYIFFVCVPRDELSSLKPYPPLNSLASIPFAPLNLTFLLATSFCLLY